MSRPVLDLTVQAWQQRHGDILAIGTWFGDTQRRPCLVLLNARRAINNERITPVIIPMDNMHLWSEQIGDVGHAARSAMQFANDLFQDPYNKLLCYRIAGVIRDHIQDVIEIPPEPRDRDYVAADAIFTDEKGRQHHKEIYDRA